MAHAKQRPLIHEFCYVFHHKVMQTNPTYSDLRASIYDSTHKNIR